MKHRHERYFCVQCGRAANPSPECLERADTLSALLVRRGRSPLGPNEVSPCDSPECVAAWKAGREQTALDELEAERVRAKIKRELAGQTSEGGDL